MGALGISVVMEVLTAIGLIAVLFMLASPKSKPVATEEENTDGETEVSGPPEPPTEMEAESAPHMPTDDETAEENEPSESDDGDIAGLVVALDEDSLVSDVEITADDVSPFVTILVLRQSLFSHLRSSRKDTLSCLKNMPHIRNLKPL